MAAEEDAGAAQVRSWRAQLDDPQQRDVGVDLVVLLRWHCDSDPVGPLASSRLQLTPRR